jgi:uncharacterized protein (TIGR00251 family)
MTATIRLRVSPGAPRTELAGRHGEGWKVRVAAPPERGRANEALVRYMAEVLGVPRAAVRVVAGAGGRDKLLEVSGLSPADAAAALGRAGR